MLRIIILLTIPVLISCATKSKVPLNNDAPLLEDAMIQNDVDKKANMLAQEYIITDGHIDLPYRLKVKNFKLDREYMGIPVETDEGDFDFVRAKKGGLNAPFMSIFIPSSYQDGRAKYLADTLINMVTGIAAELPEYYAIATSPDDVRQHFKKGIISLPMGMENGAPIEGKLENVQYFKDRGISYITLTHGKDNHICDSSYDTTGTYGGLSEFGYTLIEEMNKVGIMVDISHVSDNTFYQVIEKSKVPVIASHSSARKYTPGFERNMSDDMIKKLGENGGVIQINFGSTFLDGKVADERNKARTDLTNILEEKGLSYRDDAAEEVIDAYYSKNPLAFSDVDMVANHIDNVVKLAGIDHVGLGSDFDGVGDSLPTGLKDVSEYPNLIAELLRRGYSDEDIEKICSKNVFRVWQSVLDYAEKN
ncbi:dipeptidase [Portibacter lacus]|uniref:Dipeptidase n=1 Tax=Portibacter lacus TaxID=1099794 RepID=A0AA37WFM2_9BACT|nr:dipeptidase [Portibacter lacus]GLR17025.1 dipeptidase [Portibacter lacus]